MNLEQFLFGAVLCGAIGVLAGVLANWWAGRDSVKQMQDWENELVDRELAVQQERIQARLTRSEAQMLREEATKRLGEAEELVKGVRRGLYRAAAEAIELDDEMADTQLIEVTPAQVDAARLLIERGKTSSAIEQIANADRVVR